MKEQSFKFIDLFSGCGGFSYGLEQAGHQCLLGVDLDPYAIKTFQQNHAKAQSYNYPIETLNQKILKNILQGEAIDLVVGGPPCQGFSTVGRGQAKDARNSLFLHFVRIVSWLKPSTIILANVTGLLAEKNSYVLSSIFRCFEDLGYNVSARILSADHYGAPTIRRRTFLVGVKKGNPEDIYPLGVGKKMTVGQAWKLWLRSPDGSYFNHSIDGTQIQNKLDAKRISYIPEGQAIRYQEDQKKFLPKKLWFDVDWDQLPENRFRQKKLHRLHLQMQSPTLMTSSRCYFHPTQPRYLTAREAAALQTFPGDFIFHGPATSVFRQIGNAVPPLVARAFGLQLNAKKKNAKNSFNKKSHREQLVVLRSKAFRYQEHSEEA